MSAVTDAIAEIYNALSNAASTFKETATGLVSDAQNIITGGSPFTPTPIIFIDPERTVTPPEISPKPPSVHPKHYVIPPLPPLVTFEHIGSGCEAIKDEPDLPDKVFDKNLIKLDYTRENFDGDFELPKVKPNFSLIGEEQEPTPPTLTVPDEFTAEPLSGEPPNIAPPDSVTFDEQLKHYYLEGLGFTAADISRLHQWFSDYARQFVATDGKLFTQLQGILNQTVWAVNAEEWHEKTYQQGTQLARFEQYQARQALDQAPSSIAGLPVGSRTREYLTILNTVLQKQVDTLAKADQGLRDKEATFLQFSITNATQLVQLAVSLKLQQIAWLQQAMKVIQEGADAAIDAALIVIDFKEKELDAKVKYNDLQMARAKLSLELEKTKIESLRIELESEKLKSEYNQNNINAYQVAIELLELRVKKYQLESDYALLIKEIELLKLEVLKIEVNKYAANNNLFKLKQDLMNAKTKEDKIFFEAEMDIYLSILLDNRKKSHNTKVTLHNKMIEAQQLQQEAVIYNAKVDGVIKEFESISKTSDIAAKAIAAGSKAERMEGRLEVMNQQLNDAKALQEKIFEVKDRKFEVITAFKEHQLIIEKIKAQAQTVAQAAGVAGGISTQAFAGLNAVATNVAQEYA